MNNKQKPTDDRLAKILAAKKLEKNSNKKRTSSKRIAKSLAYIGFVIFVAGGALYYTYLINNLVQKVWSIDSASDNDDGQSGSLINKTEIGIIQRFIDQSKADILPLEDRKSPFSE